MNVYLHKYEHISDYENFKTFYFEIFTFFCPICAIAFNPTEFYSYREFFDDSVFFHAKQLTSDELELFFKLVKDGNDWQEAYIFSKSVYIGAE